MSIVPCELYAKTQAMRNHCEGEVRNIRLLIFLMATCRDRFVLSNVMRMGSKTDMALVVRGCEEVWPSAFLFFGTWGPSCVIILRCQHNE